MNKPELNKWIDLSLRKDENAFRNIVERYQFMVYSLAFKFLCDEEDAKDMTQETFIRCWLYLEKYDRKNSFTTWLYTIATNLCLDKIKSNKRFSKIDLGDQSLLHFISSEDLEQNLANKELASIISALTVELTPKQRIVFTLRYLEGLEIEEIRAITKQTPGQIKSNLFLARKTIRERINKIIGR